MNGEMVFCGIVGGSWAVHLGRLRLDEEGVTGVIFQERNQPIIFQNLSDVLLPHFFARIGRMAVLLFLSVPQSRKNEINLLENS